MTSNFSGLLVKLIVLRGIHEEVLQELGVEVEDLLLPLVVLKIKGFHRNTVFNVLEDSDHKKWLTSFTCRLKKMVSSCALGFLIRKLSDLC